jgi:RimJ/RimL family protein N-acetyltransferase
VRHDHRVEGVAFRLRPVELADAGFLVALRTDQTRSRFLNPTSPRLDDQVAWTERYFERPGDYYFVVERTADGAAEGALALYDEVAGDAAEWGRWILRPGSFAAPESALLIYRFGFDDLGLGRVYCRTLTANQTVIDFHAAAGLTEAPGPPNAPYVEHQMNAPDWPAVRARLARGAERSAALLARRRG